MKILATLLLCVACAFGADPAVGGEAKDPSVLSGKWRIIDKRLDRIGMEVEWEFTDGEVIVRDAKTGELLSRARYTIDTVKSPHWITVEVDDSPDEKAGDRRLGIFRIQQGELHLKQEITNGGGRPTGFENGFVRLRRPPLKPNAEQVAPTDGKKPPMEFGLPSRRGWPQRFLTKCTSTSHRILSAIKAATSRTSPEGRLLW